MVSTEYKSTLGGETNWLLFFFFLVLEFCYAESELGSESWSQNSFLFGPKLHPPRSPLVRLPVMESLVRNSSWSVKTKCYSKRAPLVMMYTYDWLLPALHQWDFELYIQFIQVCLGTQSTPSEPLDPKINLHGGEKINEVKSVWLTFLTLHRMCGVFNTKPLYGD